MNDNQTIEGLLTQEQKIKIADDILWHMKNTLEDVGKKNIPHGVFAEDELDILLDVMRRLSFERVIFPYINTNPKKYWNEQRNELFKITDAFIQQIKWDSRQAHYIHGGANDALIKGEE